MAGLDDLSLDQLQRLRIQRLTADKAAQYGLDPDTFARQIKQESGFNPRARSSAGAIGPGQLMPATAKQLGVDPNDPEQNLDGAARYMRQNLDRFGGDQRLALAAYHAGPGAAEAALRNPKGNPKTNAYVQAIAGDGKPDLDSMSLEELQALRAQVAGGAPKPAPQKPKVSVGKDMAKGGAGGAVRGTAGLVDMVGQMPGSPNSLLDAAGSVASMFGAKNVANALHGTADALSNPIGKAAQRNIPVASYQPQTLPGKIAEKVGEFAPNALMGPAGAGRGLVAQVGVRAANVLAPAVGAVAGREGVKAMGGGETAQGIGEFAGSLVGGIAPSLRAPKLQLPARVPKAPSLDELRTAKNAAYKAVDDAGITYTPESTKALAADARSRLGDDFDPDLHTGVKSALKKIDAMAGQPVTLGKLDLARQYVRDNVLTPTASKGERRLGYKLLEALDDHIAKTSAKTVQGGTNPEKAAADLLRARELNTRIAKAEAVEGAAEKARRNTGPSGSGGNINNNTRREVGKLVDRRRDWSPDERKALENLAQGGKGDNALRQVGKLSPSGNGLSMGLNLMAAGGSHGASLPFTGAGMIAKAVADRATIGKVGKLVETIARGGQSAQSAKAELALLAKSNPKVPLLTAQAAKRLLATGGMTASLALSSTQAAAREDRSQR
jgi:hypothetical protein